MAGISIDDKADLALRVLQGEPPADLSSEHNVTERQLRHWARAFHAGGKERLKSARFLRWYVRPTVLGFALLGGYLLLFYFAGTTWQMRTGTLVVAALLGAVFLVGYEFLIFHFRHVLVALALSYGVLFVSVLHVAGDLQHTDLSDYLSKLADALVGNAGGVFTVVIGVISVVGLTMAVKQLSDLNTRITDYASFLYRYGDFLSTEMAASSDGQGNPVGMRLERKVVRWIGSVFRFALQYLREPVHSSEQGVRILATTPTLGNVSEPSLYDRRIHPRFEEMIGGKASIDLEMICLAVPKEDTGGADEGATTDGGVPPLRVFYDFFQERFEADRVEAAYGQAEAVIRGLKGRYPEKVHLYDPRKLSKAAGEGDEGKGIFEHRLPPFNLFWTSYRAIVLIPLDRPTDVAEEGSEKRVSAVGFETTDPRVITRLAGVFEEWKARLDKAFVPWE